MITMRQVVNRATELAPFPQTAARLARVLASEQSSVSDVVDALQYDQALVANLLKLANSAMSASARRIATVREAVIRLGGARVLEQIVAKNLKGDMKASLSGYGYCENDLWRHSVAASLAAELLGSLTSRPISGLAFTAVLLHDIGKLLLGRTAPEEDMDRVWKRVQARKCSCEEAEREVFGYSHADIGAAVITGWDLPDEIAWAIRDHHSPNAEPANVTDVTKVANIVARSIGEGIGYEGMGLAVDSAVAQRLGLTKESLEKLCAATALRLKDVLGMYAE